MKQRNVVHLPLFVGPTKMGELIISTSGEDSTTLECDIGLVSRRSESVPIFDTIDNVVSYFHGKDQNPIILIREPSQPIPQLLLLEDCTYYMKIEKEKEFDSSGSFSILKEYGLDVISYPFSKDNFEIKFAGYAGMGTFDIQIDKDIVEIRFEVRSSKIEYLKQYPKMISDISDFYTSLELHSNAPLSQRYNSGPTSSNSYYEDFLLIEAMFTKMGLPEAFRYICENKHVSTAMEKAQSFGCEAYNLDSDSILDMVNSNGLIPSENGQIAGEFDPLFTININYVETYDNLENRLVKDFLLYLQYYLDRLEKVAKGDYASKRIKEMAVQIDGMLSERWLNDVSPLEFIPYMSSVLASKYGYSDIFNMYLMLGVGLSFNQEDANYLFEGHTNKVSQVYEYWCYTRLFTALNNMSEDDHEKPINSKKGWDVRLRNGIPTSFIISIEDEDIEVDLYYNHQTDENSKMRSYSVPLRPDFSLLIDKYVLIHLDSKYKLNVINYEKTIEDDDIVEVTSWRADIYKMHTYRDAIYMCQGSFILYPGDSRQEQGIIDEWYTKRVYYGPSKDDIPSVGAIKLNPSMSSLDNFENTLKKIIKLAHNSPKRRLLNQVDLDYEITRYN